MTRLAEPRRLLTDPRVIREVLDAFAATNGHAAARRYGFDTRTVYRWAHRRAADPSWPTDDDVTTWLNHQAATRTRRARRKLLARDYRKRTIAAGGPMMIDATGTTRRLRALAAIGWTTAQIAPRLGVSRSRVGHLMTGERNLVHRHTAARVAAVYTELCMTVPRDPAVRRPRQIRVHARQRRYATLQGWAPPLAWDDIDDPNEEPQGLTRDTTEHTPDVPDTARVDRFFDGDHTSVTTHADRVAIVARWRTTGRPINELARLTGWKPERYYTPGEDAA